MSELDDRTADSARVTAYLRSLQQGGGTPPIEPPIEPPVEPPTSPDFPYTLSYEVPWANMGSYLYTSGFNADTTLVVSFTVPSSAPAGQKGRISGSEYGGGPVTRTATISATPADFTTPMQMTTDNPSPLFWLTVPTYQPGKTYYFNVRNVNSSGKKTVPPGVNAEMSITMAVSGP